MPSNDDDQIDYFFDAAPNFFFTLTSTDHIGVRFRPSQGVCVQHDGITTQSGPTNTVQTEVVRVTELGAVIRLRIRPTYGSHPAEILWRVVRPANRNHTGLYPTRKAALNAIGTFDVRPAAWILRAHDITDGA